MWGTPSAPSGHLPLRGRHGKSACSPFTQGGLWEEHLLTPYTGRAMRKALAHPPKRRPKCGELLPPLRGTSLSEGGKGKAPAHPLHREGYEKSSCSPPEGEAKMWRTPSAPSGHLPLRGRQGKSACSALTQRGLWGRADMTTPPSCLRQATSPYTGEASDKAQKKTRGVHGSFALIVFLGCPELRRAR